MFCKKAILIHWGNIPPIEFDFGPVNLFSGGNGSGKTTAADALQSLMTAAHENLFNYNPGQDETTQKGRGGKQVRTLASYILGCDDGSYARVRSCQGYVAALFHPTQGESGDSFWAIMGVQASLDAAGNRRQARQDAIQFFILPNSKLPSSSIGIGSFIKEDKAGKHILKMADFSKLLQTEFGSNAVESYDKKSAYLRRLYGALRGQAGAVSDREAKHAARTFSNFMAYKPVKSINDFVAREVLEPKDLSEDIRQVSELMKTIHGMEQETRQLNESIGTLDDAQGFAQEFIDAWQQLRLDEYTEISRRFLEKQKEYLNTKDTQLGNQEQITETQHRLEAGDQKKDQLFQQITDLKAKRQGIPALRDKDELEQQRDSAQAALGKEAPRLLEQVHVFDQNVKLAKLFLRQLQQSSLSIEIPCLADKRLQKLLKQVVELGTDSGIDAQKLMTIDFLGSGDLESKLDGLITLDNAHHQLFSLINGTEANSEPNKGQSIRDQLLALSSKRHEQQSKAHQQHEAKQLEILRLENKSVNYPPHVDAAIRHIEQQCPEAKPAVLCDFIEVNDSAWQMAIEGYLGGARFSIIVEPEYEAQAIAIVRGIKGRRNNAKVIQGSKASRDATRLSLPSDSIVELMRFEHKTAEYYVKASYGSVLRVDDEQTLRKTARGLCSNGLGSGNYSMFRCDIDDADLVFGQGARERALLAKQQQLEQILQQRQQIEQEHRQLANCFEWADKIASTRSAETVKTLLQLYRSLQNTEQQIDGLDLTEFEALETSLAELDDEYRQTEGQINQLHKLSGELGAKKKSLANAITKLADEQDEIAQQQDLGESAIYEMAKICGTLNPEELLSSADDRARNSSFSLQEQVKEQEAILQHSERNLAAKIMLHNQHCNSHSAILYLTPSSSPSHFDFYGAILKLRGNITSIHNSLRNNVLIGKHEKLVQLKESFNTAFITNLCHSIYQSIGEGKRLLEDLNQELEHHLFGDDQERFYFGFDWIPEFQEYYRFFKEVINTPNLGDGASLFDADMGVKSQQVRDKLLSMLLDKDEQTALRELKRISDYRNYRSYEIYKQPLNKEAIALSTYGTGSGGQLETPAYIIRSAAVTSAFKFNEGDTQCRMVLVDEAFSKMDETRSRQVIHYLTESLGLQLIFIMPTSKSGPFMDLISHQVIFSKCPAKEKIGELNTRVLVDRKICKTDKIQELWANHRKVVRHQGMLDFMAEFSEAED